MHSADFMTYVKVDPQTDCWLWVGSLDAYGYGSFRGKKAHRVSFGMAFGSVDGVTMVCHHCDVRNCVNPSHLYAGDAKTNARDMFARKRVSRAGARNSRAKLTPADAAEIRAFLSAPLEGGRKRRRRGTMAALAKKYGVNRTIIHRVATGELWSR